MVSLWYEKSGLICLLIGEDKNNRKRKNTRLLSSAILPPSFEGSFS